MKKIVCLLFALLLLTALAAPALAASGSVSLGASATSLERGDTFTVSASLSSSDAIALGTVVLSYDTSVFEMTGGSCHVSNTAVGQVIPAQKAGTFMLSGDPRVVSGRIFTFNMRVKDTAPVGSYTISSSAAIGVSAGQGIGSGSVTVKVTCEHTYGAWTETADGHQKVCSACGDVQKEAHGWDKGTVTKEATCKEEGQKTFTCGSCKATKTEKIDKTDDHVFGNLVKVDENNHKDVCSVCNKEITQTHTWNKGTVTKQATCKDEGEKTYTCTGCKHTKIEKIDKLTTHTYGPWQSVDGENHKHICKVCLAEESATHTWNKGTVTKKATCKEEGEKTYTCTACGGTKVEKLEKSTKHTFSKWAKVDADNHERTCTVCALKETGTHSYKTSWSASASEHFHECSACKDRKDSAAHRPSAAATETRAQYCLDCHYVIKAALGHEHSYAVEWTTDETGHWHKCSGCEEKGDFKAHDFENACDPDCSVCAFAREAGHTFAEDWTSDAENHWHVCSGCGLKEDEEAHAPGAAATEEAAQNCTICGYEIAPKLEPEVTEPVETAPVTDVQPEGQDFPWWIVIVAAVAVFGFVVIVAVKKKK